IGRATASRVAREGGKVIAVDISQERLHDLTSSLPNTDITTITGDITNDADIKKIVEAAGDTVDCLANVAGIMDNMTPLHEMTDEVWNRVMGVNVLGMMKLSRAVLPLMLKARKGSIVNVGSEASIKASAAGTAYTTSKHAVVGLSKSMAFMYGPSGIRTNVIAPGAVLTNIEAKFESKLGGERVNTLLAVMPDAVEADVLAAPITFLLSDDSVNINGALLPSDGGWSVQ
ncbi:MAG TPA: SDR family oxidoreductase, partial [Candidatus Saccharimonadales bacterium]